MSTTNFSGLATPLVLVRAFRYEEVTDRTLKYHEDIYAFEMKFKTDVKALCNDFEEYGNPFVDTDENLVHLISKVIMNEEAVDSLKKSTALGERQFRQHVEKRLIKCEVQIKEKIEKNKLVLFREKSKVKKGLFHKGTDEESFTEAREKPLRLTVCSMPVARQ